MTDNIDIEKQQAEALSEAIDRLNQGLLADNDPEEQELTELLSTARLIKAVAEPPQVPADILNHIVEQTAGVIEQEKRKKRLQWLVAGCASTVAAAAALAFLYVGSPPIPQQQLAQNPRSLTEPAVETPPPMLAKTPTPPEVEKPLPTAEEQQVAAADTTVPSDAVGDNKLPAVGLEVPPQQTIPAAGETMLALADRKADTVTIDAESNSIRQVYRKGAPDEIILTQAPKRPAVLRSIVPPMAKGQNKVAAGNEIVDAKIKIAEHNTVTVTVGDSEVTLEGAVSREELLKLADTLIKVPVVQQK